MAETILFLTGKLAQPSVEKVLQEMAPLPFEYRVHQLGLSVAALMTDKMIARRLKPEDYVGCKQIIVPGRCRGDLAELSKHLNIEVVRGPDEIKDLPLFFGKARKIPDLSRYDVNIFAEIVDAPQRDIEGILQRARYYADAGANVIDIGCLPEEKFPLMEEAIAALHDNGFKVSVDSLSLDDLRRAANAGADYLLSLTEETIDLAKETDAIPILVPAEPGSLVSLERAMEAMDKIGKPWIADPILDPIHFGLTDSIVRYHTLRQKYPDAPMMMGIGNLTELTDADTTGINALLFGIISELKITNVLATEVSPHARRAIKEADVARRMMFAARDDNSLPRDFTADLLVSHERRPFTDTEQEIIQLSENIKDPNYRIKTASQGIYVFNRDGLLQDTDPFAFYPKLQVKDDPGHAFYLGVELARAQIAWQLGKRYTQDEDLQWGCAVELQQEDLTEQKTEGTTMKKRKERACGTAEAEKPNKRSAPVARLISRIHEVIVVTITENGKPHLAPMGISEVNGHFQIKPFKPSCTYDNLIRHGQCSINFVDDVRIFAGALTGHRDWPTSPCQQIEGEYISDALSHIELEMVRLDDTDPRACFYGAVICDVNHKPFRGFNRAQNAVIEAAILVSRLDMLSEQKIREEIAYLTIAIDKTAGERELEAWSWLMERVKHAGIELNHD